MKPKTKRWLKQTLYLIRTKRAVFYLDGKELCWSYPKHGWVLQNTIGAHVLLDILGEAGEKAHRRMIEQMKRNPEAIEALYS